MKGFLRFAIVVVSLLCTCTAGWATPQEDFWTWFTQNEPALFDFEKDQDHVFKELDGQLQKIDPNLTFEFGPKENGKREFVISAGGIFKSFPAVISLYDAAPKLDRWTIIKFRPRRPIGDTDVELGGVKVAPKDVAFILVPDGDKAGLLIFLAGMNQAQDSTYKQIAYLFLDQALGEYDVETKVGAIEILPADTQTKSEKRPLTELPDAVDSFMKAH